jgi:molybdopterin synthase catalytic subunit
MSVEVHIVDGPLPASLISALRNQCPGPHACGAALTFEGLVRANEAGRVITDLDYQTYDPMAQQQLRSLAEDVLARHGLLELWVIHSRGRVPVGECSLRVTIRSRHRKEALAAMDEFIDRLKSDVPIWKSPVFPP